MKGRNTFTKSEIAELERLIILRNKTIPANQKAIRQKMRNLGFYGKDDWGINDMQLGDLQSLIKSGRLKISDGSYKTSESSVTLIKTSDKQAINKPANSKANSDEKYVLDLCDKVLGLTSSRQHRFDFLLGDKNKNGKAVRLPVDSFYDEINLVVEYRELQHTESVNFFDKPERITVSGVHRGEQRKVYDERRRMVLPEYNISLIEISYSDFSHDIQKRIIRNPKFDEALVRKKLKEFIK